MLILASNSPRRKEILSMLGFEFEVLVSDCDETTYNLTPKETVMELAKRKALAINAGANDVVIGSDTVVSIDNMILGKPKNADDAKRMLHLLSGNCHEVYTGVAIISKEKTIIDFVSAKVYFNEMSKEDIDYYVSTLEPMDKAGSYAVQGKGAAYIEKIEGDFFTVMGLPASFVSNKLKEFGIYPKTK